MPALRVQIPQALLEKWGQIALVAFIIDIFINSITAFESKGVLVRAIPRVIRQYARGLLFVDLVTVIPWQFFVSSDDGRDTAFHEATSTIQLVKSLRLVRMLRVLKLRGIFRKFETFLHIPRSRRAAACGRAQLLAISGRRGIGRLPRKCKLRGPGRITVG